MFVVDFVVISVKFFVVLDIVGIEVVSIDFVKFVIGVVEVVIYVGVFSKQLTFIDDINNINGTSIQFGAGPDHLDGTCSHIDIFILLKLSG